MVLYKKHTLSTGLAGEILHFLFFFQLYCIDRYNFIFIFTESDWDISLISCTYPYIIKG
jgi:hypothetical protein